MKKRILIIVYALLLCVTASFAWISNFDQSSVAAVKFNYNNGALTVWNNNFEGKLMVPEVVGTNADGTPKEVWKDVDPTKKYIFDSTKFVPDSVTPFRLGIKNKSGEDQQARLSLIFKMSTEDVVLLNYIYINIIGIEAEQLGSWSFAKEDSYHQFVQLSEAEQFSSKDGEAEFVLRLYSYSNPVAVPNVNNRFFEFDCFFYFDPEAPTEMQHKSISAMAFRLE